MKKVHLHECSISVAITSGSLNAVKCSVIRSYVKFLARPCGCSHIQSPTVLVKQEKPCCKLDLYIIGMKSL